MRSIEVSQTLVALFSHKKTRERELKIRLVEECFTNFKLFNSITLATNCLRILFTFERGHSNWLRNLPFDIIF